MKFNFAEYYTEKDGDKTIVRIKYKIPMVNKLMLTGFGIYVLFMMLSSSGDLPVPERYYLLGVGFTCVAVGGVIGLVIARKITKNKEENQKIVIDKERGEFLYPFENFSAKLNDIKDVQIQEKPVFLGPKLSQLKLVLSSGEKIIDFPIGNYNKAEEFRKLIKDNL